MTEEIRCLIREHIQKMRQIDRLLRDPNLTQDVSWRLTNERERIERRTLLLMRKLDFVETPI